MSSEIITKNDLKAILDEVLPSCAVDYVVEQGTSGSWEYRKWNSGTYEAWCNSNYAINAGTSWLNGAYYHKTTYGLSLPSFALTWKLISAVKNDDKLAWCVGVTSESDGLHFYWVTGAVGALDGASFGTCLVTIRGTWK